MNVLRPTDLEIVGFNGAPLVLCGRSLPIARRKADRYYCVLEIGHPLQWHDEDEANSFAASKRWTRLKRPLPFPLLRGVNDIVAIQPMVVFADDLVLDKADRIRRPSDFDWHEVEHCKPSMRAACGPSDEVEKVLNDWADALLKRFDMLQLIREAPYLAQLADFALCAGKSRALRWQAYIRLATVQPVERVRRSFEAFVKPEFPSTTCEVYLQEAQLYRETIKLLPPREPLATPVRSLATTLSKLRDMASVPGAN